MNDFNINNGSTGNYFSEPVQLRKDVTNLGWTLVPEALGKVLFEEMRGHDSRDYIVFIEVVGDGGRILDYKDVGKSEEQAIAAQKAAELRDAVVANAPKEQLNPSDIRIFRDGKAISTVYIQGANSILAVGYHDTSGSPKGIMMCALQLYAFAQLNYERDKTLFINTFDYLPFRPDIGLDFSFYRLADDLIEEILEQQENGSQKQTA